MLTQILRLSLAKRGHNRRFLPPILVFSASSVAIEVREDEIPPTSSMLNESPLNGLSEAQDASLASESHSFANELFGEAQAPAASSSWNPIVLNAIQTEARKGLSEDSRNTLLTKFEAKDDLAALTPPKLNKELAAALTPSVIKREEYQALSQAQVRACLNAFGSSMSLLLRPEVVRDLSSETRSALMLFAEGVHLLSDHHYRLSLARRAFTKPSLNIVGKNAADAASIDEFLFGQNFAETLKAAQTCEKTGQEVAKSTSQVGKKTLQPIRQVPQQRN